MFNPKNVDAIYFPPLNLYVLPAASKGKILR
jgi:hypothetical protein